VRIPARLNTDLQLIAPFSVPALPFPVYVNVMGNDEFDSEELLAYEAGYRVAISDQLSLDVAVFDNYYDELQTQEGSPAFVVPGPPQYLWIPAMLDNLMEGETYGGTLAVNWQPVPRLRLQLNYAYLELDLTSKPGSNDVGAPNVAGNSPETQIGARAFLELPHDLSLYVGARYVDDLPNQSVPSYTAVDLNFGWDPTERLRIALTVHNANDDRHLEFGEGRFIERRSLVSADWRF
jgi:iron complex outermembrane receptor protein